VGVAVTPHNGPRLVFHPQGLRSFIENWEIVAARIIRRVHREAADNPSDETMKRFLEELLSYPDVPSRWRMLDLDGAPPPFLTITTGGRTRRFVCFLHLPPSARRRILRCRNCASKVSFLQMKPRALCSITLTEGAF
jgi:hypothetical protein